MRTVGLCGLGVLAGVVGLSGCTIGGDDGSLGELSPLTGQVATMPEAPNGSIHGNDNFVSLDGAPARLMETHRLFIVGDQVLAYGSLSETGSCDVGAASCWDMSLTVPIGTSPGRHTCAEDSVTLTLVRGGTHGFSAKNCTFDVLALDDAKRASIVNLSAETLSDTGGEWIDVTGGSFNVGFGN
jgi:hypothetical protein